MTRYEYKVVPAPTKGQKAKGTKTPQGRFALSVESSLNEMGALGWEYLRAELLPSEERTGLTGSTTNWRNVLVFRRPLERDADEFYPLLKEAPGAIATAVVSAPAVMSADPGDTPRLVADSDGHNSSSSKPHKAKSDGEEAEPDEKLLTDNNAIDEESTGKEHESGAQAVIRGMREQG